MRISHHKIFGLLLLFHSFTCMAQHPLPLFKKFSANDYNAHSVNQDIKCDTLGRVYVANFEGLLIYDGVDFITLHTPGITSISDVEIDDQGRVWALGANYLGYISGGGLNEPWVLNTVISDVDGSQVDMEIPTKIKDWKSKYGNLSYTEVGFFEQWNGYTLSDSLQLANGNSLMATVSQGLFEVRPDGSILYGLSDADGLNSNSVNSIATDGKQSVWGATDDGIFRISLSPCLSSFTANQGLVGDVTVIYSNQDDFYAGTMHGLYVYSDNRFVQVSGIKFVCWQLGLSSDGKMYAATADGVFLVSGQQAHRITKAHTLSVCFMDDQTFLSGELDGIYRNTLSGDRQRISSTPNIVRLTLEKDGTIQARNVANQVYLNRPGSSDFELAKQESVSHLIDYTDEFGVRWITDSEGRNIQSSIKDCNDWLFCLRTTPVRTVYRNGNYLWIGSNKGLIRFDVENGANSEPIKPHLQLRSFELNGRRLSFKMAVDKYDAVDGFQYSYRLGEEWTEWNDDNYVTLTLTPGTYNFQARVMDSYGQISEPIGMTVDIPYPFFMRWYMVLLYMMAFMYITLRILGYRTRKRMKQMAEQNDKLESLVAMRTAELKKVHADLVRKEKEATVGKLSKGLIDRILNPMNYINNFSHLTVGLIKDLKADVEDEEENMSPDNFEDAMDVLDMMKTNLQKIEYHGQSTTRILKAMEEMLKDRSGVFVPVNLSQICQQAYDLLQNYYQDVMQKSQIKVDFKVAEDSIMCSGIANQLIKCIMSLLGNSIYALQKRKTAAEAGYQPLLRIQLLQDDKFCHLHVYDNGIGMENSVKEKIFDPFYTNKPTAEAAGVGLYLTREIIEAHGGTITVESIKDDHTEFIISLPHVTVQP